MKEPFEFRVIVGQLGRVELEVERLGRRRRLHFCRLFPGAVFIPLFMECLHRKYKHQSIGQKQQ